MTATPQCSNCLFSFVAPASAATNSTRTSSFVGSRFCNRQAPSANNVNPDGWLWPLVADDWWCGDGADLSTGLAYSSTLNGIPGANGAGYTATSTTNLTIASSGSVAATTQTGLAYTAGARVRATSRGSSAWMEGVTASYTGAGVLTFTADLSAGSGSHTDWDINLAGQPGSGVASRGTFTLGAAVNNFAVADATVTATSRINITPTSQTAADLQARTSDEAATLGTGAASAAYISTKTVGVSFTMQAGNGGTFAGTEVFDYTIVN